MIFNKEINYICLNLMLNAFKNILNMLVVRSAIVYLIIYRMHHQWRHLNMHIINLILNTETLAEGSNIIYENVCIILMCTIYFFFMFVILIVLYMFVHNHTEPN